VFGFHVKTLVNGSQLIVTNPADIYTATFYDLYHLTIAHFYFEKLMSVKKLIVHALITLTVYGYFINVTQLRLDKATQMASVLHFRWNGKPGAVM
jgi:hypothetical protein